MRDAVHEQASGRVAGSAAVRAKAQHLAVRWVGAGRYAVASGSEPGRVHIVQADHDPDDHSRWRCSCRWGEYGGRSCSHVRAAHAEVVRSRARKARVAGRAAAEVAR
jgi:hypothetical protein